MKHFILAGVLAVISVSMYPAQVFSNTFKLGGTYGSGMVLQQNSQHVLKGTCSPNTTITVTPSWSDEPYHCQSDGSGVWEVTIPTPSASFTSHTVEINYAEGGTLLLHDVLVGEVWLCSGQSNMEMPLRGFQSQPIPGGLEKAAMAGQNRHLRLFTVAKGVADEPTDQVKGEWQYSTPENAYVFSAVGYMFGENLCRTLNVPVGIIVSAYGGSKIEAWTDIETIERYDTADYVTADKADVQYRAPARLYNAMLNPLTGTQIRGVVWYQGESNRSNNHVYASMLKDMIGVWRARWDKKDLPFIICQIAPYGSENKIFGAELMEAQAYGARQAGNAWMAGTSDIGSKDFIHAPDKETVAMRVTVSALANVYGMKNLPKEGPMLDRVSFEGDKAIISYLNAERGLIPTGEAIDCFELAGSDGVFYPALAKIKDRNFVEVHCPEVSEPKYVRYAFSSWHKTNLYNTQGLPAYPFRTDK